MTKLKKVISIITLTIIVFAMVLSTAPLNVNAITIYDVDDPSKADPEITIIGSKSISIAAGDERIFYFQVKNTSSFYNIGATMTAGISANADEFPFEIYITPYVGDQNYHWEPGTSHNISVAVRADRLAREKVYPVDLTYLYKNEMGYTFTKTETIQIRVTDEIGPPQLTFSALNAIPSQISAGANGILRASISNKSLQSAKNVRLSLEGLDPQQITVKNGTNMQSVDTIATDRTEIISFTLQANKNLKTANYPVTLKLVYNDERGQELSYSQNYYISVIEKPEDEVMPKRSNLTLELLEVPTGKYNVGEPATISLKLINTTEYPAKNIKITAVPSSSAIVPMTSNIVNIVQIAGGESKTLDFSFQGTEEAQNQNYPICFKVEYETGAKNNDVPEVVSFEQNIGFNIEKPSDPENPKIPKGILEIQSILAPTGTYRPGKIFSVSFEVTNTSSGSAKDIKITALPPTDIIVPMSASVKNIPQLAPGETVPMEFQFAATESSKTQNYPISFRLDYETGNDDSEAPIMESFEQYIGVNISNPEEKKAEDNPDDPKKNTPKIIISEYKCDPFIVKAGESFDLNMTYQNTNMSKTVKNIRVYLTAPELEQTTGSTIFTPDNSSNTFYIDEIPPKGSVEKVMRFTATPNAQPKTYTINVNFEYEDNDGNEFKTTELVGINVEQPSRIVIGDMMIPTDGQVGMPFNISFDFFNMGKVDVSNLMITVEGELDVQPKSTFYGNFASGYSEYFDAMVTPMLEGSQAGSIIVTYDEPTGESIEVVKDFTINVMAPYIPEDMGMIDPSMDPSFMEQEPQGFWAKVVDFITKPVVLIIGGIVILGGAAATTFLIIRAKRKKKGFDIDEQL